MEWGGSAQWAWFFLRIRWPLKKGERSAARPLLHGRLSDATARWPGPELSPSFHGGWRGSGATWFCICGCVILFCPLINKSLSKTSVDYLYTTCPFISCHYVCDQCYVNTKLLVLWCRQEYTMQVFCLVGQTVRMDVTDGMICVFNPGNCWQLSFESGYSTLLLSVVYFIDFCWESF